MKASTYLLLAGLMVVGFLLSAGPVSAWPDSTMPHYGKSQTDCSQDHMVSGTHVGTSYTFVLCKANSTADKWGASITKKNGPTICSLAMEPVPSSGYKLVRCTSIPTGIYTTTIWYTVPGDATQYSQTDQYWYAP
jgi:hypothetical protein